jgi:hypothetical protein
VRAEEVSDEVFNTAKRHLNEGGFHEIHGPDEMFETSLPDTSFP